MRRSPICRRLSASKLDRADASLLTAARRVAAELRIAPDPSVFNTSNAPPLPDARQGQAQRAGADDRASAGRASTHRRPRAGARWRLAMTAPAAAPVPGQSPRPRRAPLRSRDRPLRLRGHARFASRRGDESRRSRPRRKSRRLRTRRRRNSRRGQTDSHSTLNDGALSGVFAVCLAVRLGGEPRTPASRGRLAFARPRRRRKARGSRPAAHPSPRQRKAGETARGRLIGERAFHLAPLDRRRVSASPRLRRLDVIDAPSFAPAPTASESGTRRSDRRFSRRSRRRIGGCHAAPTSPASTQP